MTLRDSTEDNSECPRYGNLAIEEAPSPYLAATVILALICIGAAYWLPSTLFLISGNRPGFLTPVLSAAGAGLSALAYSRSRVIDRATVISRLMFMVPLIGMAMSAFVRSETSDVVRQMVGLVSIYCLCGLDREVLRNALWKVLFFVASSGNVLSLIFAQLTLAGRDFLPGLYDGRVFGIIGHPNGNGLFAGLLVVVSFVQKDTKKRNWGILIGVFTMFAAASQSVIIALVAASFVAGTAHFLLNRGSPYFGAFFFAIVAALSACSLAYGRMLSRGFSGFHYEFSVTGRTDVWRALVEADKFIWGLSSAEFVQLVYEAREVKSAHNLALEIWLRYGVPGLIGILIFVLVMGYYCTSIRSEIVVMLATLIVVLSLTEGVLLFLPYCVYLAAGMKCVSPPWGREVILASGIHQKTQVRSKTCRGSL